MPVDKRRGWYPAIGENPEPRWPLPSEITELDGVVTGPWLNFDEPVAYWRGARAECGLDPMPDRAKTN